MPYINEIVDIINQTLATGKLKDDERFVKNLHGVAEPLPRNINGTQDLIPSVVDLNGGTEFSGFEDQYSIVLYHRVLSTTIGQPPVMFGDGANTGREEARMRMVVFADRLRIQTQPTQLSFLLNSALQQQLSKTHIQPLAGLYGANIVPGSTNYNGVQIYSDEYRLPINTYPVHPHQIYIALDYSIITDYDVTCISDCPTC